MKTKKKPLVLAILDGFGHSNDTTFNAISQAHTPHLDAWFAQYPHTLLNASGSDVGLLSGLIGNSEVGHQTIGAGRVIPQPVSIIHEILKKNELCSNKKLSNSLNKVAKTGKTLHILGLLSDAGVHSHQELLYALIKCVQKEKISSILLHLILDGRDTPPQSAQHYLHQLETLLKDRPNVHVSSLHGRFYAMDRDGNLDRTKKSYDLLAQPNTPRFEDWQKALDYWYNQDITDEFIPPTSLKKDAHIKPGDGIIFFNFRPDRARQLSKMLIDNKKNTDFSFFITPFSYQNTLKTTVLFDKQKITNTLTDILHEHNKTTFAIAETEKYAHITYFFNYGRHKPFENETWTLIPSIKTRNYAESPEMSAPKITQKILDSLKNNPQDFYLINYANADMVGHTGNLQATIKAVECLDEQLNLLYDQVVKKMDGTLIITADHGNAEQMFDITHDQPHTAHTTNKVPFLVLNKTMRNKKAGLQLKNLADIAPYILKLMHLPIPEAMEKS